LFGDKEVKLIIEFDHSKNGNREVSKIRMDVESMHKTKGERRQGNGRRGGERWERRRRKINLKRVRRKENDIDRLPT